MSQTSERRPDLDWIRVGAFFLLILYHVGMFYVPWGWHVKSPHPVEWLEPLMQLTNPWRLTLLFVVSGAATRFMADKMTAGALARARVSRLLPPLIFAMLVIVPPQTWLQVVESAPAEVGSGGAFYLKYVTASGHWRAGGESLITPTWNHMWFVAYLFVYSLLLAAAWAVARAPMRRLGDRLADRLDNIGLLLWPVVVLALFRLTLRPFFEETHNLVWDWYVHAESLSAFLFGFLTARSETLKARFVSLRWPALMLAIAAWAAWAGYNWIFRAEDAVAPEALKQVMRCVYALDQWGAIVAVLGFGARHITRGGPALRYLTLGVFPFYIVHQTVIVVAGHYLARLGLNQALEAAILIATTFAACFLTYEIVRRVPILRPLFGLRYHQA